jgi:tRNA A-37 threonylcarbamoyl transferase component Bud32
LEPLRASHLPELRLLGRYEPLAKLARGGMAVVYIARQVEPELIERPVVLKRLHEDLRGDERSRALLAEARTLTHVRHPNVVPIIDVVATRDEAFLVLEYVEGVSLARLEKAAQDAGERIPVGVASRIMSDVLAGLHAAHEAKDMRGEPLGIIHRDVSPQNVLVGADGVSRLIDFGVAKSAGGDDMSTSGSVIKGKVGYFAPEQIQGLTLDRRVDIFAAGVVLHELVAGKRLFRGDDHATILMRILIDEIPPLPSIREDASADLDVLVTRALSRDRDDRPATASDFLEELSHAASPASAVEVARFVERLCGPELEADRAELRGMVSAPRASTRPPPRRRIAMMAIGAGALAVLVAGTLVAMRSTATATATATASATATATATASATATATADTTVAASADPSSSVAPSTADSIATRRSGAGGPRRPNVSAPARATPPTTTTPVSTMTAAPPPSTPLHSNPYAPH